MTAMRLAYYKLLIIGAPGLGGDLKQNGRDDGWQGHFLAGYVDLVGSQLATSNPDINSINPAGSNIAAAEFCQRQHLCEFNRCLAGRC